MFPMSYQMWVVVTTSDVNGTSMHPIAHLCIHVSVDVWNSAELLSSTCGIANMTWLNSGVCWHMWFVEGVWYDYNWCHSSELVTCLQSLNLVILKLRYINCVWSFMLKFRYINLLIVFGISQDIKLHGVYYFSHFQGC